MALVLGLFTAPALAGTGITPRPIRALSPVELSPVESARLRTLEARDLGEAPDLGELRAGAVTTSAPLQDVERTALRAAEARDSDLQSLRAGDLNLSDHDLTIIAVVLAVVIIIIII
jgi:hypothetical protein